MLITKTDLEMAHEKLPLTTNVYDAILIEPLYTDSWESGYRDLNIYGLVKTKRQEKGFYLEKIMTNNNLSINSFLTKLKKFEIFIDSPYLKNIIQLYCKNHLIKVYNHKFTFIKDRRK